MLSQIAPSKRFKLRYSVNDLTIAVTSHAIQRSIERGIDLEERIDSLRGKPVHLYRRNGVIVDWKPWKRLLVIITVF